MGNFDEAPDYGATIANPASPVGLRQVAAEGAYSQSEGLQPWYGNSYTNAAQDWYGGRNIEGQNNGWSNEFTLNAVAYAKDVEARAGVNRDPRVVFSQFDTSLPGNEKATGIAAWDVPEIGQRRGDVFENGVKKQNLYESMDTATADVLMGEWLFTGDEKRDIFADSDPAAAMRRAVSARTDELTQAAVNAPTAFEFNADVQERQADIQANPLTTPASVTAAGAGGAAMGAGLGAAAGAAFFGVGALPGAIVGGAVGAVVGGVGAWLNQDQITEQVARASEITDRALQRYNPVQAVLTSSKEWGGVGMKAISPFSNVYQGVIDATAPGGSLGDGRSEFYEVDQYGQRKVSGLVQAGDIGATLLDSVAQFGSPISRGVYMGVMGTMGVGGLGGALTTGATFNQWSGTFDPFESPTEWIGGIASPLIDVAQMGMAGAVTRSATKFAREADQLSDAARATYTVERGGMRFTRSTETGEVLATRKWTLGALAPSENIWQVPIRWKARTIAMKSGRYEVTGDDLFRAAQIITAPASRWRGALVNGLAEGYEEAWQGILDPMSVSENINGSEVFVQALYGGAGGVGMSLGALTQRTSGGRLAYQTMPMGAVENEARLKQQWRTGELMTDEQWEAFRSGLSDDDLRRLAMSDAQEALELGRVVETISDGLTIDNTRGASVLGDAFARKITEVNDSGLNKANPNAEESLTILGFENEEFVTNMGVEYVARSNAAMMSSVQLELILRKRVEAIEVQLETASPETQGEIALRLEYARVLHAQVSDMQRTLAQTTDIEQAKFIIRGMNEFMQQAYDGEVTQGGVLLPEDQQAYFRKVATLVLGRHPFLDSGSFAGFLPQVSFAMTVENPHAAVGIHQAFLKPMQADHDGDRTTTLNLAFLPDDTLTQLRQGLQQFGPVAAGEGSALTHGIDMPDGENVRMIVWTEELRKPATTPEHQAVWSALLDVEKWILERFADKQMTASGSTGRVTYTPGAANATGPLPWDTAVKLSRQFREQFEAGDPKAMQTLRDALLNTVGAEGIAALSVKEPVLTELQQFFSTRFLKATRELARLRMTSTTATPLIDQQRPADVVNQKALSMGAAATVSQTLNMMGHGEPTRDAQMLWYSTITRILADVKDLGWTPALQQQMARLFLAQTTGDTRTEAEVFLDKDPIQGRVLAWLDGMVRDIDRSQNPAFAGTPTHELRAVLSMMSVPSVKMVDGQAVADPDNSISLMQYLLRKSIQVETDTLRNVPEDDPRWRKLKTLTSLTYDNKPHSYTPKTAAIEMFRFLPVEMVVGTADAGYLGSNTTLDQRIIELSGLHPVLRKEEIHRLKSSPAYMREQHRGLGDPPYTLAQLLDGNGRLRVNAYTLMVDALETAVNKLPDQLALRDKAAGEKFRKGLSDLHNYIDGLKDQLLRTPGTPKEYTDEQLVRQLIVENPELADMIVALIPEAAWSGTFHVQGMQVFEAPWLMSMLTERKVKKAEKDYFVYKHLSMFNQAGAEGTEGVEFDKLQSRFQQTLFIAAEDPTGFLMAHMLQKMDAATSVDELLASINDVPALLGDRAPLLAYLDDVAQFESTPASLWNMGLTSTQLLETLERWSSRVKMMSDAALQTWTQDAADKILLQDVATLLDTGVVTRDAQQTLDLIRQARRNRQRRPDSVGPTARNDFLRIAWDPFVPMQDKGAAPEVARFIESILTSYSFGVQQGWEQGIDSVAKYTWRDVSTNVTLLLDGPVEVMMPSGETLRIDMSDDLTVVRMLQDPSTRAFAKAVLFDTVRDVDTRNSLQHYSNTATNGSISELLREQNNIDLLSMDDASPRARQLKAHRGIGLVESALIKQATTGAVADQGAALLPITRAMGEMLVAYTSRADLQGVNRDRLQGDVIEDTWALLVAIASKSPYERKLIRTTVLDDLRRRQGGTNVMEGLKELFKGSPTLQSQLEQLLTGMADQLVEKSLIKAEEARDYESQRDALPDTNRTPMEQRKWDAFDQLATQAREEITRLVEQATAIRDGNLHLVDDSLFSADVAKEKYLLLDENEAGLTTTEQERRQQANAMTRLNIRNLLELGNNKEAFRGKGVALELLEKLALIDSTNLDRLNDPELFTTEDWQQLSMWAATVHFTALTERSADQALRPLGIPTTDRLYDRTYTYLTDIFFNEAVLEEVAALINPALAAMPSAPIEDITSRITGRLLNPDRLGPWNSTLVAESMKISEMVVRGPVGLAVAAAGSHATRQRAMVGTSTATVTEPLPEHMATLTLNPNDPDPAVWRKIANGFFTELTITNVTTGQTRDIAGLVGVQSMRTGMNPAYLILRKRNWDEGMAALQQQGFYVDGNDLEVSITFVDPDLKPYTPEYVNSVYFDKAGRTEETMPLGDVISESIFSTEGWSKVSQQRVFDVAARGGSAGFPTPMIPQLEIDKLDRDPLQAAEFIRRAAQLLLDKQYNDMNAMLDTDQAAVIKLLKQRFIVVGMVNGERRAHWIDEIISMQGQLPFDPGTAEIVGLSAEVASTLLSERGTRTTPGLVTSPLVNPNQMPVPTAESLDPTRLEQLGLTALGETIDWNDANSPLKSFSSLRTASMSDNRGDAYMRTYRERMKRWNSQVSKVAEVPVAERMAWREINSERLQDLSVALSHELMLTTFAKMGLSSAAFNTDAETSNLLVRSQLDKFFGPEMSGRRIFTYTTQAGDLNIGKLSRDHIEGDFLEAGNRPPVYGDFVIINLDEFVTGPMTQEQYDEAARQVQEVMEAFGNRGVRIFLQSEQTSYQVKERIATWMQSNPMGYESVHNSTSVYVPIIEFGSEGKTTRALRQSLTATDVFHPRYVAGRILSDDLFPLLGANENTVLVDTEYDGSSPWTRMAQLLAPGDLTISDRLGAISLNYPTPSQMGDVQKLLLPLIEDPQSWQLLVDAAGPDPAGIQLYSREQFAGDHEMLTPGILSTEAARQRLIALLTRGTMPTVGDETLPGEFLPLVNVTRDGSYSVVLSRTGFTLPNEREIRAQWSERIDPENPMRVAISPNEINDTQTVPPPMMITQDPIYTANGMLLVGEFEHHKWGKWIDAALGFKAGRVKMSSLKFRGAMSANDWRPSEAGSLTSESGKLTTGRIVNNFQDLFSVTGFDIRNLLVDGILGKQASQQDYDDRWTELKYILDRWARTDFGYTEDQLYRMMTLDGLTTGWQEFNSFLTTIGEPARTNPVPELFVDDPTTRITAITLMTLMAPRIRVEHLVSTPGMMTVADRDSETLQIVTLPALFTKSLQNPNTPDTMKYLFDLANSGMPTDVDGGLMYWFDTNFKLHTRMDSVTAGGTETVDVVGWLQLVKPTPATEDLNSYANANTKARKDESLHIAGVINSAIGATTNLQRDFEEKFQAKTDGDKIIRFGNAAGRGIEGDLWSMLTRIQPREDAAHRLVPLQWKYLVDSLADVRGYSMAFDKTDWDADIARVRELQADLLRILGLDRNIENQRVEVDYLVRQFYGTPGARDGQVDFVEPVTPADYIEAVRRMIAFAKENRNPLEAAKVPFPHETLWRKIHEAGKWAPALGRGVPTRLADTWEEYVYALFGQIEQSKQTVDTRFRRPMDGFMQTYRATIPELANVAVSGDAELNQRLLDPEVNKHFISMDPGVSSLLENPVILAEMEKTISNLIGLTQDVDPIETATMDSSALIAHRDRVDRWAKNRSMAPQVKTSYLEYLESGTEYVGRAAGTHAFMSGIVNLSLINRLFNPALFVSAVFEVWARTGMETFTDLVMGDQLRAGGVVAGKMNWTTYSPEQVQQLRGLARQLATNTDFMEYIYKELVYTHLVDPGRGRLGNALESGATKVARAFSDPRWGMPANSVALLYLGAALENMTYNGASFTIESFVQQMEQDPLFLVKNSREEGGFSAHKAGLNRVAQVRSMKPTVLGKAISSPINTLTNGSMGYNFVGHLLKIPFMFANFMANTLITMTGLGGTDQIIAMWLDGRNKPGFINRMDAHIRGEKPLKDTYDMSDVLEGIDLSRAFIRGGITQTGLFAAALFAQGLGLGGEDDEMRKRRRLAEYLNTPLYLDPLEMQNDFRYADAIFLDEIPILNTIFKDEDTGRSVVVPHWIIRQFTSPMMGTMRFMQTGDPRDITQGFADAFSVIPFSMLNLWKEASMTADLLFQQANEEDYEGNSATAQSRVTELLITAVSIYEKALLENSFINGVRNGSDEFNRNPWLVSATGPTGDILMREGTNNMPLRSQALESYTDPATGEVRQGYDTRSGMDGYTHQYAENNLTFSLLASLFTGQVSGESTYLRNNMVVGETKIELPQTEPVKAEAILLSAYMGQGGQQMLTFDEAVRVVKAKYEAAGVRWNQGKVEEEAKLIVEAVDSKGHIGGMSVLSPEGAELITKEGAKGVYHSLSKGMMNFDDIALAGVWIDMPTRKAIEAEWAEDLIQEGVDMGLPQQSAEFRMRRIMLGDPTDPEAPGLRKILYSDKIPYSGTAKYNQLNMTYMIGPDGKPWATPFRRAGVLSALGIPVPQTVDPAPAGMTKDSRGNLVDEVFGINLGVMGLQRQLEEPPEMPDLTALDQAGAKTYTPQQSNDYTPFKRYSSGGGGSSYGPNFNRMYTLPKGYNSPRPDDIPFINVNTPYVRRARVNTERISSDRGRLKSWQ